MINRLELPAPLHAYIKKDGHYAANHAYISRRKRISVKFPYYFHNYQHPLALFPGKEREAQNQ